MKRSHTHLHNGLPVHSLQAQIFLPAALKVRMMFIMWQVNSHNIHFLHFMDNDRSGVARTDNRLWKIQGLFEIINVNF
jgi:hypothetical protein